MSEIDVKKSKPIVCWVKSNKMDKSGVGVVRRLIKHPRYKKYVRRSTNIMFHDEKNEAKVGDKVLIEMSKPYSAKKRFRLIKIVETGKEGI